MLLGELLVTAVTAEQSGVSLELSVTTQLV